MDAIHPVAVVELSREFKTRVREAYQDDRQCRKLLDMLLDNQRLADNAARLPFTLRRQLIYSDERELGLRLVIPTPIEKEIFVAAHNQLGHPGFARTHERVTQAFYIFGLGKKLKSYIAHCPDCLTRQTPRHRPFGSLQPILAPARPFHTLSLDFILALPVSVPDRFDCALPVTDKFTKAVTIIPGNSKWTGPQWAVALLDRLHLILWGVPQALISDRDAKFTGDMWRTMLDRLGVRLIFTTAWHPSADGASERTNQTVEIALRYYLASLDDHRQWPTILPRLSAALSNSTSRGTGLTATQILYGNRVKEGLDLARADANTPITDLPEQPVRQQGSRMGSAPPAIPVADRPIPTIERRTPSYSPITPQPETRRPSHGQTPTYSPITPRPDARLPIQRRTPSYSPITEAGSNNNRPDAVDAYPINPENPSTYLPTHIDAKDAIALAAMTMKAQYDARHLPKFFKVGDWVSLRLHRGYTLPGLRDRNPKLEQQFAGPFQILERINRLSYRIRLPPALKNAYPVISIAHLEPAPPPNADPYNRGPAQPILTPDGQVNREVDRLIRRRDQ